MSRKPAKGLCSSPKQILIRIVRTSGEVGPLSTSCLRQWESQHKKFIAQPLKLASMMLGALQRLWR